MNFEPFFTPLDLHFARFLVRISGSSAPALFIAAALVSRYRSDGHICIDLASLAGKSLPAGDIVELETGNRKPESFFSLKEFGSLPELADWMAVLAESSVVGKPGDYRPLILDGTRCYLYRYWDYENRLALNIKARAESAVSFDEATARNGFSRLFPSTAKDVEENDLQRVAAFAALARRFCVISGGPGTGKTFVVAKILALLLEQAKDRPLRIAMAAPTGKAAARLQESLRNAVENLDCSKGIKNAMPQAASTIHRLLGSLPNSPAFRYHAGNPLPADVVIVDEASMADLALLSKLVQAIPPAAGLILLGDKDQLASVEAGAVLGDICESGCINRFSAKFCRDYRETTGGLILPDEMECSPGTLRDCIVQLEKSYRFGASSGIGSASRAVNDALNADAGRRALEILKDRHYEDISWSALPSSDLLPVKLRARILDGFSGYLKTADGSDRMFERFDLFQAFRILCALREGPYGVRALNIIVEDVLRKAGLISSTHGRNNRWYRGRPIMITQNDYGLRLYNGDVGIAWPDIESEGELRVFIPAADGSGFRTFLPSRLPDHETAFAVTVHKSQGSEFDVVLLLLPERDTPVLTRELVYTGMTRAKKKVEIWGKEEIFLAAVSRRIERASGLSDALSLKRHEMIFPQ